MFDLPENARLGTAFADVSFFAGEQAEEYVRDMDREYFSLVWASSGYVNATLNDKALLELFRGVNFGNIEINAEDMAEDELFSALIYTYMTILPGGNTDGITGCSGLKGEQRRLYLRLIAALYGRFSLMEELFLCSKVMEEMQYSFLKSGEENGLSMICATALAVLEKRINGGTQT